MYFSSRARILSTLHSPWDVSKQLWYTSGTELPSPKREYTGFRMESFALQMNFLMQVFPADFLRWNVIHFICEWFVWKHCQWGYYKCCFFSLIGGVKEQEGQASVSHLKPIVIRHFLGKTKKVSCQSITKSDMMCRMCRSWIAWVSDFNCDESKRQTAACCLQKSLRKVKKND